MTVDYSTKTTTHVVLARQCCACLGESSLISRRLPESLDASNKLSGVACVESRTSVKPRFPLVSTAAVRTISSTIIDPHLLPWFCVLASSTSRVASTFRARIAAIASINLQTTPRSPVHHLATLFSPKQAGRRQLHRSLRPSYLRGRLRSFPKRRVPGHPPLTIQHPRT